MDNIPIIDSVKSDTNVSVDILLSFYELIEIKRTLVPLRNTKIRIPTIWYIEYKKESRVVNLLNVNLNFEYLSRVSYVHSYFILQIEIHTNDIFSFISV